MASFTSDESTKPKRGPPPAPSKKKPSRHNSSSKMTHTPPKRDPPPRPSKKKPSGHNSSSDDDWDPFELSLTGQQQQIHGSPPARIFNPYPPPDEMIKQVQIWVDMDGVLIDPVNHKENLEGREERFNLINSTVIGLKNLKTILEDENLNNVVSFKILSNNNLLNVQYVMEILKKENLFFDYSFGQHDLATGDFYRGYQENKKVYIKLNMPVNGLSILLDDSKLQNNYMNESDTTSKKYVGYLHSY